MYSTILSDDSQKKSDKFLLQLMTTKIDQVESKTMKSKFLNNFLKITIMFLAGASTVLLGVKQDYMNPDDLKNLVLFITALITFLSGLAILWNIETYWIRIKVMLNRLKALRYKYAFYLTEEKVSKDKNQVSHAFLKEFLEVIEDEYWEKLMKSRLNTEDPAKSPDNEI